MNIRQGYEEENHIQMEEDIFNLCVTHNLIVPVG